MAQAKQLDAVSLAAAELSPEASATCLRCGYDLTGLDDRRACPECGLLVGLSRVDGEALRENHPRWLRRLSRGCWLLAVTPVACGVFGFSIAPFDAWFRRRTGAMYDASRSFLIEPLPLFVRDAAWFDWLTFAGWLIVFLLPALTMFVAVVSLARPSGRAAWDREDRWRRRLLWILPVLMLAITSLPVALVVALSWLDRQPLLRDALQGPWPFVALFLLLGVGLTALTRHLSKLARRAPAPLLAADSPIVGYTLAGCAFVGALLALAAGYNVPADGGPADLMFLFTATYLVTLLTAAIWSVYLLVRYALAFRKTARQAAEVFAGADRATSPPHPAGLAG